MEATIALAGNPNSGKTTLFNTLTGARQHVGNYPGVTVEKKHGTYANNGSRLFIVDLPGTYSMTAYSLEEVVARDFLVNEKPKLVIDIVDASNLERNLYLSIQLLEMGIPLCLALNMMDLAKARGIEIDTEKLSQLLGIPVLPIIACKGQGTKHLMDIAEDLVKEDVKQPHLNISYGDDLDNALNEMEGQIQTHSFLTDKYPARWIALKYLESDEQIMSLGKAANPELADKFEKKVRQISNHIQNTLDTHPELLIADQRYGYIRSLIKQGVIRYRAEQDRLHMSDKIDRVLTHRFAGPLVMITVIMGLYHFTFTYSELPAGVPCRE